MHDTKVPTGRSMLTMLGILVFLALLGAGIQALSDPVPGSSVPVEESSIEDGIDWLLRGVRPSDPRHKRSAELAGLIYTEGAYYEVDPHLVLATLFAESSLRLNRVGAARAEIGLGQLHGTALRKAKKELKRRELSYDTLEGQVAACAWLLKDCRTACKSTDKSIEQAARYLSGKCRPVSDNVVKRAHYRLLLTSRLENVQ